MATRGTMARVVYDRKEPRDAVQGLIAQLFSMDTGSVGQATDGRLFVGPYDGLSRPVAREARGILPYEPLFEVQYEDGSGDPHSGGVPEVMSALNNVNLIMAYGTEAKAKQAVFAAKEDKEKGEEVAQVTRSMIRWIGVNRDKELGPQRAGALTAPDSGGTVALSGKLTLDEIWDNLPVGAIVEFYVPNPYDVYNESSRTGIPVHVKNKVTLRTRVWEPKRWLWRPRRLLKSSALAPKNADAPITVAQAKWDHDFSAAHAFAKVIEELFTSGFWIGAAVGHASTDDASLKASSDAYLRKHKLPVTEMVGDENGVRRGEVLYRGAAGGPANHHVLERLEHPDGGNMTGLYLKLVQELADNQTSGSSNLLDAFAEVWKDSAYWTRCKVARGAEKPRGGSKPTWAGVYP